MAAIDNRWRDSKSEGDFKPAPCTSKSICWQIDTITFLSISLQPHRVDSGHSEVERIWAAKPPEPDSPSRHKFRRDNPAASGQSGACKPHVDLVATFVACTRKWRAHQMRSINPVAARYGGGPTLSGLIGVQSYWCRPRHLETPAISTRLHKLSWELFSKIPHFVITFW